MSIAEKTALCFRMQHDMSTIVILMLLVCYFLLFWRTCSHQDRMITCTIRRKPT